VDLSHAEILAFLDAPKVVPESAPMRWTKRNVNAFLSRLPLEFRGIRVGELFLMTSVATRRCWRFKVLRQRSEVLRWDFTVPPSRHRNASTCGADLPRVVTALEHEHLWHPDAGLDCARPLTGLSEVDHREALDAFCRRAKIDMRNRYVSPPPMSEQLAFDDQRN